MSRVNSYLREITQLLAERQHLAQGAPSKRRDLKWERHKARRLLRSHAANIAAADSFQQAAQKGERDGEFTSWLANKAHMTAGDHDLEARCLLADFADPEDTQRATSLFVSARYLRNWAGELERESREHYERAAVDFREARILFEETDEILEEAGESLKMIEECEECERRAVYITERARAIVGVLQEHSCGIIPQVTDFETMVTESRTPVDIALDEMPSSLDDDADAQDAEVESWRAFLPFPHLTTSERAFLASEAQSALDAAASARAARATREALWGPAPDADTRALWEAYPHLDNETLYECQLRKRFEAEG